MKYTKLAFKFAFIGVCGISFLFILVCLALLSYNKLTQEVYEIDDKKRDYALKIKDEIFALSSEEMGSVWKKCIHSRDSHCILNGVIYPRSEIRVFVDGFLKYPISNEQECETDSRTYLCFY